MFRSSGSSSRSGFTLLEVLVALLLLAGALLAVAQLMVVAGRSANHSSTLSVGAALAAQKIEQLRAAAWGYDLDGTPLDGVALSPPGSLTADAPGFVDYLDDLGAVVGSSPPPPAHAAYARRWSIESDVASAPGDVLTLRVAVYRRPAPTVGPAGGTAWVEVARVVSARTRRPG